MLDAATSLPRLSITPNEKKQVYLSLALLVVGGLAIAAAAISFARIGILKHWWHTNNLHALTQNQAIIIITLSTPMAIASIVISIKMLKDIRTFPPEWRPFNFKAITREQFLAALIADPDWRTSEQLIEPNPSGGMSQVERLGISLSCALTGEEVNVQLVKNLLSSPHATSSILTDIFKGWLDSPELTLQIQRLLNYQHQLQCLSATQGAVIIAILEYTASNPGYNYYELNAILESVALEPIHQQDAYQACVLCIQQGDAALLEKLLKLPQNQINSSSLFSVLMQSRMNGYQKTQLTLLFLNLQLPLNARARRIGTLFAIRMLNVVVSREYYYSRLSQALRILAYCMPIEGEPMELNYTEMSNSLYKAMQKHAENKAHRGDRLAQELDKYFREIAHRAHWSREIIEEYINALSAPPA